MTKNSVKGTSYISYKIIIIFMIKFLTLDDLLCMEESVAVKNFR